MAKTQQIVSKNGRWPEEFLRNQISSLVDQLSKHEKWNNQAAKGLRESDHISSSNRNTNSSRLADCAHISADTEVDRISAECSAKIITQIRNALSLISEDLKSQLKHNYGRCEQCDTAIGFNRLEAIPWTTKCTDCQSAEELR